MVLEALQQHGNDNDGGGNGAVQEGGDVRSGEDVGDDAKTRELLKKIQALNKEIYSR